MRILVCTPAYGGQVTTKYFMSFVTETIMAEEKIVQSNLEAKAGLPETYAIGVYMLSNESLISRARNHCAQIALKQQWDKIFFIDADMGWKWKDFKKIADSDKPIIAGVCALKDYPVTLNFMPFAEDQDQYFEDGIKNLEGLERMREAKNSPELKVPFTGTAFMCIDMKVIRKLVESGKVPTYQYPNPFTGNSETHWDLFPCSPVKNRYLSEDWGFCHLAREHGFDIHINADVRPTHTGSHTFHVQNYKA